MKKKRFLLYLPVLAITLSGCFLEPQEVGPIPIPESEAGTLKPLTSTLYPVDKITVKYQAGFEVTEVVADFKPKGIIKGNNSPLIPLDAEKSDLANMGFITYVSLDGRSATLTYGDAIIQLQENDPNLFINNKPGVNMLDIPIFNNSTLYVPIIPILRELDIHHEIIGDTLVIGGQYTDGTAEGHQLQQIEVGTLTETEEIPPLNVTTETEEPNTESESEEPTNGESSEISPPTGN